MDEEAFTIYLKKSGKKPHVIENLIGQVRIFETFVTQERQTDLTKANAKDFKAYVAVIEATQPGRASMQVRGLAMYFHFIGRPEMATLAHSIREAGTAKTRKVFRLEDFQGVNQKQVAQLEAAGIVTVDDMLAAGKTPEDRRRLAEQTFVPLATILELVKLSDLARLGGLKSIRARLYYDAGVDTPEKIAGWDAEKLRLMLVKFVKSSGFQGIAPLPKEVQHTVAQAKELPRLIQYD
jgi:hypothetical protein